MLAFDTAKILHSGALRFCGPDLKRLGDLMPEPEISNSVFGSPVFRDVGGCWRMYYLAEGIDGKTAAVHAARYAESADGIAWEFRSALTFEGVPAEAQVRHLSVLEPCAEDPEWKLFAWVFCFEAGFTRYVCFSSEDGVRFRCLNFDRPCLLHPVDSAAGGKAGFEGLIPRAVNSPDRVGGLSFEELLRRRRLLSNDSTVVYRLPGGGFELYSVWLTENPADGPNHTPIDNAPTIFRMIQRRSSADGIVWTTPEIVIPNDPDGPFQLQYYYLNMTRFGSWRLGMLGRYPCDRQIIEPELVLSRDGRSWERPWKQPWIRLEDEGERAGLIHTGHHFVDCGESWRVYYSVSRYPHNNRQMGNPFPRRRGIYAAEVGKGRLLGLSGSGIVETRPFLFSDGSMRIDANVRGSLRFELLDLNGRPLPGRTLADSLPVSGDSDRLEPRWKNADGERICCDVLSLRIEVEDGTFYRLSKKPEER